MTFTFIEREICMVYVIAQSLQCATRTVASYHSSISDLCNFNLSDKKPIYDKFITDKRTSIALCSTLTAAIGKKRRSMLISIRKIKRDIIENYKAIY